MLRRLARAEDLDQRPRAQRQQRQVGEQVERAGAVEPLHHAPAKSIEATHLVLWTPGTAGAMIRAG